MEFRTTVNIPTSAWKVEPHHHLLFVGSCFADNIGKRFSDNLFHTTVNPFGVMYNPASVLHTLERMYADEASSFVAPDVVVLSLGTNHVYILNETGEIVDNCEKRPQRLFTEKVLSMEECTDYLTRCITLLQQVNPDVRTILTVSPIRYAKYGFHESQLSKGTLLMAINTLNNCQLSTINCQLTYFPSYEILLDELRDYRFYASDMLHPSEQAVDYIYERFAETFFSEKTHRFVEDYRPIRQALNHRPFNPESEEYRQFIAQTKEKLEAFKARYQVG
ncbi:MAG: GSCFA domain-containing protein [Prevotella sp.]|nr:GSCFA domain-containing protein [Prevotella sp.]